MEMLLPADIFPGPVLKHPPPGWLKTWKKNIDFLASLAADDDDDDDGGGGGGGGDDYDDDDDEVEDGDQKVEDYEKKVTIMVTSIYKYIMMTIKMWYDLADENANDYDFFTHRPPFPLHVKCWAL